MKGFKVEPGERPHQLILSGDQIYADDVALGLAQIGHDHVHALRELTLEDNALVDDRGNSVEQLAGAAELARLRDGLGGQEQTGRYPDQGSHRRLIA